MTTCRTDALAAMTAGRPAPPEQDKASRMTAEPIILAEEAGLPRRAIHARVDPCSLDDATKRDYEMWVARSVFALLQRHYGGHLWFVDCSVQRGGVAISIPILLGGNWVYFIKLADLTPGEVVRAGGEILERYRLPRGRFELGSFLAARNNHSILIHAARKPPG